MATKIIYQSQHDPKKIKSLVLEQNLIDENKLDEILNYKHSLTYL